MLKTKISQMPKINKCQGDLAYELTYGVQNPNSHVGENKAANERLVFIYFREIPKIDNHPLKNIPIYLSAGMLFTLYDKGKTEYLTSIEKFTEQVNNLYSTVKHLLP